MKYILWIVSFLIMFGFVLPFLISYHATELVIAGVAIGITYLYVMFNLVKKELMK